MTVQDSDTTIDTISSHSHFENFSIKDLLNDGTDLDYRVNQFNNIKESSGDIYRKLYRRETLAGMDNRVVVSDPITGDARTMTMFGSNNYLGMANHPRVIEAMRRAALTHGVGGGGSPLLCGTSNIHDQLEKNLSSFKGMDETVLFSSGFAAQLGWTKALIEKNDIVFMDAYSHASFQEGVELTRCKRVPFKHNDMRDLRLRLTKFRKKGTTAWIFVEGVYSMHGDIADLATVVKLAKEFDCKIAVDDAHGVGVLGATGKGIVEQCHVDPQAIDIYLGTFSKAFGTVGGFVCTSKRYADYIRWLGKSHMFSASLPVPTVAAINESLEILKEEPERCEQLRQNVKYLVEGFRKTGIDTSTQSAIVPIVIPVGANARKMAVEYDNEGVFVNLVEFPAVPIDQQRFRITVIATHTQDDLDQLIKITHKIFKNNELLV